MNWTDELKEHLGRMLSGLESVHLDGTIPAPETDLLCNLAPARWRALAALALERSDIFEIHCWNGEEGPLALALSYGARKETGWEYGVVVSGTVTPAFAEMVLAQPPWEEGPTPFFNLFLGGLFSSCHYGTEVYCAPELLEAAQTEPADAPPP